MALKIVQSNTTQRQIIQKVGYRELTDKIIYKAKFSNCDKINKM